MNGRPAWLNAPETQETARFGVEEVLGREMDDRPILDDPARVDARGTPQSRLMKCVSWICRSMAGPPLLDGSAMSLDQSGLEITRVKWAARMAPYRPDRTASSAKANSGTNGKTWPTMSGLPASRAAATMASASSIERAIGFSTSTGLPARSAWIAMRP